MKQFERFGLAMLAAALLAFAAPASATTVTSPAGTEYTGEFHATASSSLLMQAGFVNLTCTESTIKGRIESNGGATAGGKISTLSFSSCGATTFDVLINGSLSIEATGEGKGIVRGSGSQWTTAFFGISCVYGTTTNTTLGTVTGGTPAKMSIAATLPKISGGFLCADPASMSGSYQFTSPSTLLVD
ncbi:MAG TPA: hypothetical protein VD761_07295 [Solirubrobacterales bacterium]|nr:hypothetical protein [Solirubrobacterales bacterium]